MQVVTICSHLVTSDDLQIREVGERSYISYKSALNSRQTARRSLANCCIVKITKNCCQRKWRATAWFILTCFIAVTGNSVPPFLSCSGVRRSSISLVFLKGNGVPWAQIVRERRSLAFPPQIITVCNNLQQANIRMCSYSLWQFLTTGLLQVFNRLFASCQHTCCNLINLTSLLNLYVISDFAWWIILFYIRNLWNTM